MVAAVDSIQKAKVKQDEKTKQPHKPKKPKKKKKAKQQAMLTRQGKKVDAKRTKKPRKRNKVQPQIWGRTGFSMSRKDAGIIRKAKRLARKSKDHDPSKVNDVETANAIIKLLGGKKPTKPLSTGVKRKKTFKKVTKKVKPTSNLKRNKISKKKSKRVRPRKRLRFFRKIDISKELANLRKRNDRYKQLLAKLAGQRKINRILRLQKAVLGKSKKTPKRLFVFPRKRQFGRRWNIRRRPFSQRFRNRFRNQRGRKRPFKKGRPTKKRQNIKKKDLARRPGLLPPTSPVDVKAAKALIEKTKEQKPGSQVVPKDKIRKVVLKQPTKGKTKTKGKKRLHSYPKFDLSKNLAKHRARTERYKQMMAKLTENQKGSEILKGKNVVIGESKQTPKRLLVFPRQNRRKFGNRRIPTRRRWKSRRNKPRRRIVTVKRIKSGKNKNTNKKTKNSEKQT